MDTFPPRREGPLVLREPARPTLSPQARMGDAFAMTELIVGVDGSQSSLEALRWAGREAELRQSHVVAVMAWGFLDQHHENIDDPFDPLYDEDRALEVLESYVGRALGPASTGPVGKRVVNDLPAPALLAAAQDASMLVLGARGLGGFRGLLLGSVSQHCLHHARCPVAVVRHDGVGLPDGGPERIVVGIDGSEVSSGALAWAADEARLRRAELEVVLAWHEPYVGAFPLAPVAYDRGAF